MSSSVTVIGGVSGTTLTGILTTPVNLAPSVASGLQDYLSALSSSVTGGSVFLNAENIIGQSSGPTASTDGRPGLLELSNTNTAGDTQSGSVSYATAIPAGYTNLVVEAPGTETISGNNSTGFFGLFGNQSQVQFNSGGSGTIVAAGSGDYVGLINGNWSVVATGGDTVNTSAATASIVTSGADNVVGLLGGASTVLAGGTGDLVETYNSGVSATISVAGANERILLDGGSDTVYAVAGQSGVNAFFEQSGGSLDFINNSGTGATVSGAVSGAIGGSVTAFGGAGGGTYIGGPGGNNSLIGGTGVVTLYGSGTGNLLSVSGSGGSGNFLSVGNSGSSTLVASSTTGINQFTGGSFGTTSMFSAGHGQQNFFIGDGDTETITGSTASDSLNIYHFEAPSVTGSGNEFITNFRYDPNAQDTATSGYDRIKIDETGSYAGQVTISGITTVGGGSAGSLISLSDNTTIKLIGVTFTSAEIATLVGGNSI